MDILVKRIAKRDTYTIGKLYINGKYYCDTVEDKDRGLTNSMTATQVLSKKIKGVTAIPTGTYTLTMKLLSPRYKKSTTMMQYCKAYMPRLLNVPGYEGVLIHTGNTAKDSEGCIILGYNKVVGKVINSLQAFKTVYPILKAASDRGETIKITIQ